MDLLQVAYPSLIVAWNFLSELVLLLLLGFHYFNAINFDNLHH